MTAIFTESWDGIGTTRTDYVGKWTSFPTTGATHSITSSGGISGNYFLGAGGSASMGRALTTAEEDDRLYVGAHHYFSTFASPGEASFMFLSDSGATVHNHIRFTANGGIVAARGGGVNGGGTVLSTTGPVLQENTWHYIEVMSLLHDTTGAITVRVDGVAVMTLTNVDTKNAGTKTVYDRVDLATASGRRYDNIYILNEQGSTNNNFLGDVRIDALFPDGNGNSSQFTGSDGNSTDNYLLVDDLAPDDDTTYVQSGTTDHKDTYSHTNTTTNGTVAWVAQYVRAKRTDSSSRDIALVARHSSSETTGADQVLAAAYAWHKEIYATNPSTAAAWTLSEVDAAEFGYKSRPT